MEKEKPDGLGLAGAIISIIGAVSLLILFITLAISAFSISILGLGIFFLILAACPLISIIMSSLFIKDYKRKIPTGIMALIFGGLIGGIFILVSSEKSNNK